MAGVAKVQDDKHDRPVLPSELHDDDQCRFGSVYVLPASRRQRERAEVQQRFLRINRTRADAADGQRRCGIEWRLPRFMLLCLASSHMVWESCPGRRPLPRLSLPTQRVSAVEWPALAWVAFVSGACWGCWGFAEVWWFGLVLLTRGPLLSVPSVVAPNMPAVQFVCLLAIMSFGEVMQVRFRVSKDRQLRLLSLQLQVWYLPWKAPILNLVDGVTNLLLVLLLAIGLGRLGPDPEGGPEVLDSLAATISAMMILCWHLLACYSFQDPWTRSWAEQDG